MHRLIAWLPSVACCLAIQGFWLGALNILEPQLPQDHLQSDHRFEPDGGSTLEVNLLGSRG